MPTFSPEYLHKTASAIFRACGTPPAEAGVVADMLVASNLMGFDSHGVLRVPQYLRDVREGRIVPGAPVTVLRETATTAVLDGHWNFGQVGASRAVDAAIGKAKSHGVGCVTLRRCRHVGCVGVYPRIAARQNLLGLAMCGASRDGNWVCPWGGREGRLATNPISFAAPTGGEPLVLDFSTSAAAEGKVRLMRNKGERAPEGWLLDSKGRPSTDPNVLYEKPRGAILPFGGAQGYKGFGLSLMVQILSCVLGQPDWKEREPEAHANFLWFLAVDINAFMPPEQFLREVDELIRYARSSPPAEGFSEIVMPGELDARTMKRRQAEGIPVDDVTWRQIEEVAAELHVQI